MQQHGGVIVWPQATDSPAAGYRRPIRVAVTSKYPLVRDAVCTALTSEWIIADGIGLPGSPGHFHEVRRRIASQRPDLGLLLSELDDAAMLREAASVVAGVDLPWVLVTATPPGPAWGAILECGARDIVPTSRSLDELTSALRAIQEGVPVLGDDARRTLIAAWHSADLHQRELTERIERLSAREMEVLVELNDGHGVKLIAQRSGVTEGTVRTQVKAILRKLGVSSQLQAVASYRSVGDTIRR